MTELDNSKRTIKELKERAKKYKLLTREEEYQTISDYQIPLFALRDALATRMSKEVKETAKHYKDRIFDLAKHLLLTEGTSYYNRKAWAASNKMTNHNLRVILKYSCSPTTNCMEATDLVTEGTLGLLHALDRFDRDRRTPEGKTYRFLTFALPWIRQNIQRAIQDKDRTIRIPIHIHDQIKVINKHYYRFSSNSPDGRGPTAEELSVLTGYDVETCLRLGRHRDKVDSLDESANDEETQSGVDFIAADEDKYDIVDETEKAANHDYLIELLSLLTEEDALFMSLRWGLKDKIDRTDKEMAAIFKVRPKEIVKREAQILEILKNLAIRERVNL